MKKIIFIVLVCCLPAWTVDNDIRKQNTEWFTEAQFGMFIHFGLDNYVGGWWGNEFDFESAQKYNPSDPNPDQWIRIAKDLGMNYAVLTAKHATGHCLWDSDYTDFDVANSPNTQDVVQLFVDACHKNDLAAGLYYCFLDLYHNPKDTASDDYFEFVKLQLLELMQNYTFEYFWLDIPWTFDLEQRTELYSTIKDNDPDMVVMMNAGFVNAAEIDQRAWPTDVTNGEETMPEPPAYDPYKTIDGETWYVPLEVCWRMSPHWFWRVNERPKPVYELYQAYQTALERGANFLLNIPPDTTGQISANLVAATQTLKKLIDNPEMLEEFNPKAYSIESDLPVTSTQNGISLNIEQAESLENKEIILNLGEPVVVSQIYIDTFREERHANGLDDYYFEYWHNGQWKKLNIDCPPLGDWRTGYDHMYISSLFSITTTKLKLAIEKASAINLQDFKIY